VIRKRGNTQIQTLRVLIHIILKKTMKMNMMHWMQWIWNSYTNHLFIRLKKVMTVIWWK